MEENVELEKLKKKAIVAGADESRVKACADEKCVKKLKKEAEEWAKITKEAQQQQPKSRLKQ